MMIEKAHEGAIRQQRNNAVRFVGSEFQASNPDEDDDQSQPQHTHAKTIETSRFDVEAPYSGNA